jgi:chromosome partitioning protein
MADNRTNFSKQITSLIKEAYGEEIRIFKDSIPHSVRAAETSATGKSIFTHDPNGRVAAAYAALTGEVLEVA